jgi:hypothetical protein
MPHLYVHYLIIPVTKFSQKKFLLHLTCVWHTNWCSVCMLPVSTPATLDLLDPPLLVPCVWEALYSTSWQPWCERNTFYSTTEIWNFRSEKMQERITYEEECIGVRNKKWNGTVDCKWNSMSTVEVWCSEYPDSLSSSIINIFFALLKVLHLSLRFHNT